MFRGATKHSESHGYRILGALPPNLLRSGTALCQASKSIKGREAFPGQQSTSACPQVASNQCPQPCLTRPGTKNEIAGSSPQIPGPLILLCMQADWPMAWWELVSQYLFSFTISLPVWAQAEKGQRGPRAPSICIHLTPFLSLSSSCLHLISLHLPFLIPLPSVCLSSLCSASLSV